MPTISKQLSGVYSLTELNALLSKLNNALLGQPRPFNHRLTLIFRSPS